MHRREFTQAVSWAAAAGLWLPGSGWAAIGKSDAALGVRAALERGANAAVSLLGRTDGFLGNDKVRIGLPSSLEPAAKVLRFTGQGRRVDELVTAMNRAAEEAVPQAKGLLISAIKSLSVEDALQIVRGSDTAVTEFFSQKTREPLRGKFLPIVTRTTSKVKLAERYNVIAGKAASMGLVKGDEANVESYVTRRALDGLFLMIAEEEKKIRADPVQSGSAILRKVFGR